MRIGTTPGGVDILSPEADPATGWRRVTTLGNLGENLSATFHLPPRHYYWSMQAVDASFAGSRFATEHPLGSALDAVTNSLGSIDFTDATAHLSQQKFYRVRSMP